MTNKKKIAISIISLSLIIPLVTLLSKKEITTTYLSDNFFLVSLFFIIIGVTILVLSSGFFDFFQKNMKQLMLRRKSNEPKEYIPLSQIFEKKPVYWLSVGGTLLLISIIFAFLS